METKIIDKATCPHCEKEFDVKGYGYKQLCPLCGGKIDVFPNSDSFIETPWGTFGVQWKSKHLELVKGFLNTILGK